MHNTYISSYAYLSSTLHLNVSPLNITKTLLLLLLVQFDNVFFLLSSEDIAPLEISTRDRFV